MRSVGMLTTKNHCSIAQILLILIAFEFFFRYVSLSTFHSFSFYFGSFALWIYFKNVHIQTGVSALLIFQWAQFWISMRTLVFIHFSSLDIIQSMFCCYWRNWFVVDIEKNIFIKHLTINYWKLSQKIWCCTSLTILRGQTVNVLLPHDFTQNDKNK